MRFFVAGLSIDIISPVYPSPFDRFFDFSCDSSSEPDIRITLCPVDHIGMPDGQIILNDTNKWILHPGDDHCTTVFQCSARATETEPMYIVEARNCWSEVKVTFYDNNESVAEEVAALLGTIILKNKLALNNGFIIHAAAVQWQEHGLLFTAPSGTGKSTHADLWCKGKDAVILNDDSPVVRLIEGNATVFGTPWCGSRNIYRNSQKILSAIVVLEQSPKNEIRRLEAGEVAAALLPRCFLPFHDKMLLDKSLASVVQVVDTTPVYLLKCRPDYEAVRLVAECLK